MPTCGAQNRRGDILNYSANSVSRSQGPFMRRFAKLRSRVLLPAGPGVLSFYFSPILADHSRLRAFHFIQMLRLAARAVFDRWPDAFPLEQAGLHAITAIS